MNGRGSPVDEGRNTLGGPHVVPSQFNKYRAIREGERSRRYASIAIGFRARRTRARVCRLRNRIGPRFREMIRTSFTMDEPLRAADIADAVLALRGCG
jgi:hypothetical protein